MTRSGLTMHLLRGFELRWRDVLVDVPLSVQRLLSFLALSGRSLQRRYVADTLWPDAEENRAQANLRTALWRLHSLNVAVVTVTPQELALSPDVWVDAQQLHQAAREHRRTNTLPDPETLLDLRGDLLPGCWDGWLAFDRERLRHEAISLLEASGHACMSQGDNHLATLLGLCAVDCDPLRESANLLVVQTRLADGDLVGALQHADRYAKLLAAELDIPPPPALDELLWRHRRERLRTTTVAVTPIEAGVPG